MADGLHLRVWSPSETLLDISEVSMAVALLPDGEIGLFPKHTNLMAETVDGDLCWVDAEGEHSLLIYGGILRVHNQQVLIFTSGIISNTSNLLKEVQLSEDMVFDRLARQLMTTTNLGNGI